MRTSQRDLDAVQAAAAVCSVPATEDYCNGLLGHRVSATDLAQLASSLGQGCVPPDLDDKLGRLRKGGVGWQFLEKQCRVIIALLRATMDGSFRKCTLAEQKRLLWVLAYVRKDEDAIADYHPGGFVDDQEEVRKLTHALDPLLHEFKDWRLRHQVPAMWGRTTPSLA
jgi:hypothetical protein